MRKFWKRTTLFLMPLTAIIGMIILTDPYNYYRTQSFVSDDIKHETSFKFHYPLWKAIQYNRTPKSNILLGDSRTDFLGTQILDSLTSDDWYNFAYGGSTLPEIIETFWYADSRIKLRSVFIGMNFNLFNGYKRMNRVDEAKSIISDPVLYPFNKTVLKAFCYNIYYAVTGITPTVGIPDMSPDEFWIFQLQQSAKNYYSPFTFAEDFMKGLRDIALHCKKNNIELCFFIPPTHTDLQKRIDDFGLRKIEQWWINELQTIAPVINMDIPNDFTSLRSNFKDPYHLVDPMFIIRQLAHWYDSTTKHR